ncbi:MAG: nitrilase family protein, partial [Deltaproteobacteria bacterium]|nr:nitrilase family protein [Deltaproteobacteria bacterium]
MRDIKITLIQTGLVWEDIDANISLFNEKINAIGEKTDLVILPEMFTTGFTLNASKLGQGMDGTSVKWLQEKSNKIDADITGSIIVKFEGKYYNRLFWAKPDGELLIYDKRHLFRFAQEEKVYTAGD